MLNPSLVAARAATLANQGEQFPRSRTFRFLTGNAVWLGLAAAMVVAIGPRKSLRLVADGAGKLSTGVVRGGIGALQLSQTVPAIRRLLE